MLHPSTHLGMERITFMAYATVRLHNIFEKPLTKKVYMLSDSISSPEALWWRIKSLAAEGMLKKRLQFLNSLELSMIWNNVFGVKELEYYQIFSRISMRHEIIVKSMIKKMKRCFTWGIPLPSFFICICMCVYMHGNYIISMAIKGKCIGHVCTR